MNFKENKAIYLQIADRICNGTLLRRYQGEERIPSVREYAAVVEVDANTVMCSFEYLQSQNIIYNKRSIGCFTSVNAKDLILLLRWGAFLKDELEHVFCQFYTLGVPDEELSVMYRNFMTRQK